MKTESKIMQSEVLVHYPKITKNKLENETTEAESPIWTDCLKRLFVCGADTDATFDGSHPMSRHVTNNWIRISHSVLLNSLLLGLL